MTKFLIEQENDQFETFEANHVFFGSTHIVFKSEAGGFLYAVRAADVVSLSIAAE